LEILEMRCGRRSFWPDELGLGPGSLGEERSQRRGRGEEPAAVACRRRRGASGRHRRRSQRPASAEMVEVGGWVREAEKGRK
jgi:hypothetical protein